MHFYGGAPSRGAKLHRLREEGRRESGEEAWPEGLRVSQGEPRAEWPSVALQPRLDHSAGWPGQAGPSRRGVDTQQLSSYRWPAGRPARSSAVQRLREYTAYTVGKKRF